MAETATVYLTDDTPLTRSTPEDGSKLKERFLYYGDCQLTDKKCIKNVYVCENGKLTDSGRHTIYCLNDDISEGDYLTTSTMYGVATKIINKDFAFAKATSEKLTTGKVVLINVVFL